MIAPLSPSPLPSPSESDHYDKDEQIGHSPPLCEQDPFENTPSGPRTLGSPLLLGLDSQIEDLRMTAQFIDALRDATLEQSNMQSNDIEQLHAAEPNPLLDVTDSHFVKALRTFLSTTNSLQATYNDIRSTMLLCYPDNPFLSFNQMKQHVEQLSGVVPIFHNMCQDTCVGSTGPLRDLDHCPIYGKLTIGNLVLRNPSASLYPFHWVLSSRLFIA